MQFKLFIIITGLLLIISLWTVYLIVQHLKIAKFFSTQKQKILNDIVLLADINTVLALYSSTKTGKADKTKNPENLPKTEKPVNPENSSDLQQALETKNTLWKTRKQDFNQLWKIFLPLLAEITENLQKTANATNLPNAANIQTPVNPQKQPKSFYKKINTTKDMLYEHVHEYNEGILSIAKKNSKKFYRLVNKLFGSKEITELPLLKIDFD